MEIVINITEHAYKNIKDYKSMSLGRYPYKGIVVAAIKAIKQGKPLPKGHGKLIDEGILWDSYHDLDYDFYHALEVTPTVIEAEEGEE